MIIDGKKIAQVLREEIRKKVESLEKKPGLAVILVGEDPASKIYVNHKEKACKEVGIKSDIYRLDSGITEKELLDLILRLNDDDNINGILVQMPLPKHIDPKKVVDAIYPLKDVDGFSPVNLGNLFSGNESIVACTPKGIIRLIESTGVKIEGADAVVIGRSNIVGKPVGSMLINRSATVTVCHSKTKNLADITRKADILIAAVGISKFIKADMVKEGAVVIDVGMNRTEDGLTGDVDYKSVNEKAGFITPVPGGVGPMTIAMLLDNTLQCYNLQNR